MKLVNRSYLIIHPKNPFWEWAAGIDNEIVYNSSDDTEGTLYLIEEDFFDIEPIIEKHFKKIFINELSSITDEEENWPSERNLYTGNIKVWSVVFNIFPVYLPFK